MEGFKPNVGRVDVTVTMLDANVVASATIPDIDRQARPRSRGVSGDGRARVLLHRLSQPAKALSAMPPPVRQYKQIDRVPDALAELLTES